MMLQAVSRDATVTSTMQDSCFTLVVVAADSCTSTRWQVKEQKTLRGLKK